MTFLSLGAGVQYDADCGERAAFEEDEDAVDAGDVVGPEKAHQRLILVI